jgi:hypothetical protein
MRLLSLPDVAAFLLAAALVPRPGTAADATHPLDPAAPAGVVPTDNVFEGFVPLLGRENPVPSFASETTASDAPAVEGEAPPPAAMPMDHGAMDHSAMGHGAPQARVP